MEKLSSHLKSPAENIVMDKIRGSFSIEELDDYFVQAARSSLNTSAFSIASVATSVGISVSLRTPHGMFHAKLLANGELTHHYRESVEIQKFLVSKGFPCTKPIGIVQQNSEFSVLFEEHNVTGEYKDSHDQNIMKLQVQALVELHELLRDSTPYAFLLKKRLPTDSIWIEPHSPIFDFSRTSKLTQWIDEKGKESRRIIDGRTWTDIVSHADWSNKHFRFIPGAISVIYDWDSLCLIDELYTLGLAAATYTATWEFETKVMPSPEEARQFVIAYQVESGRSFSKAEIDVISAYSAHMIGYWGRCIVALNPRDYSGSYFEAALRNTMNGLYF